MDEQLDIIDKVLGRRLARARIIKQLTETETAKAVGITPCLPEEN